MATYKEAGVDIDLADKLVERIRPHAESTFRKWPGSGFEILSGIGGHAAVALACDRYIGKSMDGIGMKVRIAALLDKLDTIGDDLVGMCANDLWTTMTPEQALFTDYIATGKLSLDQCERIVVSIARACKRCNIALVGGETAEMPMMYSPEDGEFELVGDVVGIARPEPHVLNGKGGIQPGMRVWGLPSNGLHANGYSLVHKVFGIDYKDLDVARAKLDTFYPELGSTLGEELMRPTRLYTHVLSGLRDRSSRCIGGFAHITGGGLLRNIRRMLPPDCTAVVNVGGVKRQPIFDLIERVGNVKWLEMHRTFNCGIGLIAVSIADLDSWGFIRLGEIREGNIGDKGLILYQHNVKISS